MQVFINHKPNFSPTRRPSRSGGRGTLLFPSMEKIALLPPLLFVFACVLFVTSYQATFSSGVLAPLGDSLTPPISLLMFAGTGRRIGQVGFPTLCVGFYVCMRRLRSALLAAGIKGVLLFGSANTAFAALAVVGLVPLRHELIRLAPLALPPPTPSSLPGAAAARYPRAAARWTRPRALVAAAHG